MPKATIKTLTEELHVLAERVHELEMDRANDARRRLELLAGDHAMREALLQFTQELAARDGFSVELFVARFEAASHWHRDRFLRTVERFDPHLAAHIDNRSLTDIPTDDLPPCILPE
jgi:hypothetical protein